VAGKVVVVEDALIASMAKNAQFLSQFPFLRIARTPGNQKRCCRKAGPDAKRLQGIYAGIRIALASLNTEKATKLRELLGAEQVVIKYRDYRGKPAERILR